MTAQKFPDIHFKVYPKKVYDKRFEELKKLRKGLPPNEISKISRELFDFPMTFGMLMGKDELKDFSIYRARAVNKGDFIDETDPSHFSYAPSPKKLRCNVKGQQVFYGARDGGTAMYEIKKKIIPNKTIVYVSRWAIKDCPFEPSMHMIFHGLPENNDSHVGIMASATGRGWTSMIQNMEGEPLDNLNHYLKAFQEIFTYPGTKYYHLSSAYIHEIFENMDGKNSATKGKISMPIVAYPSVARNKEAVNFVFKKEFVDNFFCLQQVDKMIVTSMKDGRIGYKPISKGVLVGEKIEWSNFQIKVSASDYDWAFISDNEEIGQNLMKVNRNDAILQDRENNKISINEYLSRTGVSYRTLIDGVTQMTKDDKIDIPIEPLKKETMSFIEVHEELYWKKNRVKQIGFPFWYKIGYQ